jgi:hypothetical protein
VTVSLIYVYCLVRAAAKPSMRGVPDGVPGASSPRVMEVGRRLWAVVANVPARDYDEAALARGLQNIDWVGGRAMAHEAVVEHFLTARAVLPMQLFTLFTSEERAAAHVGRNLARIERILARIEGQLEWGLRLTFDEQAVRSGSRDAVRETSGSAYLARKREQLDGTRARLTEARAEADRLYRALSREATESRRRHATEQAAPGSRLLLDAAFLVPARRSGTFRAALRRNARQLHAGGIVASLTGPWPPYNFVQPASRRPAAKRPVKARRAAARRGVR